MKRVTILLIAAIFLSACVREVKDVRMSRSIFLKAPRGATVYVDIRNTSQTQSFPLESKIVSILSSKGYRITTDAKEADIMFRANVRYSGLAKDVNTGAGAYFGAHAGALAGIEAVHGSNNPNYAAGAAGGMVIGALVGYAAEEAIAKSTFISIVDILIEEKGNPFPNTTSFMATLREHGLEMQQAADQMVDQVAIQIANIF